MSETPDISMDLLEIEDIVPPPEIESVFLEEEGEERVSSGGRCRRRCGLDPVLRTKSYDRG